MATYAVPKRPRHNILLGPDFIAGLLCIVKAGVCCRVFPWKFQDPGWFGSGPLAATAQFALRGFARRSAAQHTFHG